MDPDYRAEESSGDSVTWLYPATGPSIVRCSTPTPLKTKHNKIIRKTAVSNPFGEKKRRTLSSSLPTTGELLLPIAHPLMPCW